MPAGAGRLTQARPPTRAVPCGQARGAELSGQLAGALIGSQCAGGVALTRQRASLRQQRIDDSFVVVHAFGHLQGAGRRGDGLIDGTTGKGDPSLCVQNVAQQPLVAQLLEGGPRAGGHLVCPRCVAEGEIREREIVLPDLRPRVRR